MSKRENQKRQNAYLERLNLGEFHLIVVIIRTAISPGERELDVVPREDAGLKRPEDGERSVGEGGGGRPARDEEAEGVEGTRACGAHPSAGSAGASSSPVPAEENENAPGENAPGDAGASRGRRTRRGRRNACRANVRSGTSVLRFSTCPGARRASPIAAPRTRTEMESTLEGTAITHSIFLGFRFPGSLDFCFLRLLFVFSLVVGMVVVVIVRVGVCWAI